MRRSDRTFRNVTCLVFTLMVSAALAACGGGGSSTSPGTSGPAKVAVSVASAPSYPAGTTFATSPSSPATAAPPGNSPEFDHVWVTVTKIALIPSTGIELPEESGETESQNSSAEEGGSGMPGFKTATLPTPIRIDLRNPTLDNAALLLNTFSGVPAGEYSKIRLYYDNVVGESGDNTVTFHPTAHYHFDVHFVGGNLVIPVATDPDHGIQFYSVVINVVGLKYHQAGQSGNVLLRPQVFATMADEPLQYKVTGVADNVTKSSVAFDGTFDIHTNTPGDRTIPTAFDNTVNRTTWAYSDNVLADSPWVIARDKEIAVPAFENGAIVSVIGVFDTDGRLQASHITFSFPDVREGRSDNVWIPPDNTAFIVRSLTDNVTVFPTPTRSGAYYDNLALSHGPLDDTALENNLSVKVRGYFNLAGDLEAYWISIGDTYIPAP